MTAPNANADTEDAALKGVMLRGAWYYAAPSAEIRRGGMTHKTLLGEPVLVGRDAGGAVFALRDTCPHRGTLLSRGAFDGREVECPYHGWRFATDGRCTAIPSQCADQKPQASDIRAAAYPVAETHGNIWIYVGTRGDTPPPLPVLPDAGAAPKLHLCLRFPCNIDLAVIGLMDPAHGAFVHKSALWRTRHSIHEKRKSFSPAADALGWRMDRHPASSNSRAYRIFLGGRPETEITYTLPSVRVEHATTGRYSYTGLTACTPVTADITDVHHVMYWNVPGGALLRPLVAAFARRFLDQDRQAVLAMQEGLAFAPPTMLVRDADTQTRWYYRLKREWLAAQGEGRPPVNSLTPAVLKWRS
ncbi:MAG: aromatic ring-hydroxylating oxygenase subunit alpha [Rhodospirillaceae bacterium]